MKYRMSTLLNSIASMKFVLAAALSLTVIAAPAAASAAPSFFEVDKPTAQRICYRQLGQGNGWRENGFKNLDHCLRYVSTPAPTDKQDCKGGWWFVYGFNNQGQCVRWVVQNGGGGYGGAMIDDSIEAEDETE